MSLYVFPKSSKEYYVLVDGLHIAVATHWAKEKLESGRARIWRDDSQGTIIQLFEDEEVA